jgi:hypothetical protein
MLALLVFLFASTGLAEARRPADWDLLRAYCAGGAPPIPFRLDCREERRLWLVTREGRPPVPSDAANGRRVGYAVTSIAHDLPFTYRGVPTDGIPLACGYEELAIDRSTSLDLDCAEVLRLSSGQVHDLCVELLDQQAREDPAGARVRPTGAVLELCADAR